MSEGFKMIYIVVGMVFIPILGFACSLHICTEIYPEQFTCNCGGNESMLNILSLAVVIPVTSFLMFLFEMSIRYFLKT